MWNTAEIFKLLGDTPGVIAHCAAYAPGTTPPASITVAMWKHRGRISYEWLPVVVAGLLDRFGWDRSALEASFFKAHLPAAPAELPTMEALGL